MSDLSDEQLREWRDRYPDQPYAELWSGKALITELLALRAKLELAEGIVRAFAQANPKWTDHWSGTEMDPCGSHAWLAACAQPAESAPLPTQSDEERARELWNKWPTLPTPNERIEFVKAQYTAVRAEATLAVAAEEREAAKAWAIQCVHGHVSPAIAKRLEAAIRRKP